MLPDHCANPLASAAAANRFMLEHWQHHPAVVRAAVTDTLPPIDRSLLFDMACDDRVESRLIRRRGTRWRLDHGPFERDELPGERAKLWTLLVQSVDHHHDMAADLLHQFRFVPDARLDDLMVSIAGDGGGVGPHTDSYDVFLLQLAGTRRWTLGRPGRHVLQPDQPLRLVETFSPIGQVELTAGDMLYVPPGWVHDGVALGGCITASIGFRAPDPQELLAAWLTASAERIITMRDPDTQARYRDVVDPAALRQWRRTPARLPDDLGDTLRRWLQSWQPDHQAMQTFIGCYLTEPKDAVWFDRASTSRCRRFERDTLRHGIRLDRASRIAYRGQYLFFNGEAYRMNRTQTTPLRRLADQRTLPALQCQACWSELTDYLSDWHAAGWLHADGR